ncbi:hypothetical protein [Salinirubrum litoreum]|uniref:Uncharacterized protein n=1 Tax=Salinirubrum litoreum TaxID=1126234 RepID=A0ABD5RBG4_9EURY|nr:hypothetical protein [Salinirubrum litoreum]
MALRDTLRRAATPLVLAGITYICVFLTLVVGTGVMAGSDPARLATTSVTGYFVLAGAFAGVIAVHVGRRVSRRVQLLAVALLVVGVGVRFVDGGETASGLLSMSGLFVVVYLPYLVGGTVLLRIAGGLVSPDRVHRLTDRPVVSGSLLVVGAVVLVVTVGPLLAIATASPAVPPADWSPEEQLAYLESTDQADRETGAFVDRSRDTARIERVLSLARAGAIDTPQAQLDAAVVLHHGTCPAHFELAHRYAVRANDSPEIDPSFWIRATYDRWQVSIGNEQRYGTQAGTRPVNATCVPPVPEGIETESPP